MVWRHILAAVFVCLGVIFTFSPELLEHSPVGFERRGAVHHIWHYTILMGGTALLLGIGMRDRLLERIGLIGCGLPVVLNLIALMTADHESLTHGAPNPELSGMDVALRVIVIAMIVARLDEMRREDR